MEPGVGPKSEIRLYRALKMTGVNSMKRVLIGALTAVALSVSPFALTAAVAAGDQSAEVASSERLQHWASDHRAMMDARLGGMKEALKPTAAQYPLWEVFEDAVHNADKARTDDMREMMQNRERMSPVERLDTMAGRMGRRAAEVKSIAAAAKPFYASLDDTQKRNFAMLGREMLTTGGGPMWEDTAGDAGGTWLPAHWDWMQ
jgi:zinc resistance-associated protein